MACQCNGTMRSTRPGDPGQDDFTLAGFRQQLTEPTWKNVLLWLTFFIAVLSFLKN